MAGQITLTEQEARAPSSPLDRRDWLAAYEEQTHQDRCWPRRSARRPGTWSTGSARGRRPSPPRRAPNS